MRSIPSLSLALSFVAAFCAVGLAAESLEKADADSKSVRMKREAVPTMSEKDLRHNLAWIRDPGARVQEEGARIHTLEDAWHAGAMPTNADLHKWWYGRMEQAFSRPTPALLAAKFEKVDGEERLIRVVMLDVEALAVNGQLGAEQVQAMRACLDGDKCKGNVFEHFSQNGDDVRNRRMTLRENVFLRKNSGLLVRHLRPSLMLSPTGFFFYDVTPKL